MSSGEDNNELPPKGKSDGDNVDALATAASKLDVAIDDIIIDETEADLNLQVTTETMEVQVEHSDESKAEGAVATPTLDTGLLQIKAASGEPKVDSMEETPADNTGHTQNSDITLAESVEAPKPPNFGSTDIREPGHVRNPRHISRYDQRRMALAPMPCSVPPKKVIPGNSKTSALGQLPLNSSHRDSPPMSPQRRREILDKARALFRTPNTPPVQPDDVVAEMVDDDDKSKDTNSNAPPSTGVEEIGSMRGSGESEQEEGGNAQAGEEGDNDVSGAIDPEKGEKRGGDETERSKTKTDAKRDGEKRRKRLRRQRDRQAAANEKALLQADKRSSQESSEATSAKLPMLQRGVSAATHDCNAYLDAGNSQPAIPGSDLVTRHGPISVSQLRLFAREMHGREGRNEVEWESLRGTNLLNPRIQPTLPHGLRLHQLGLDGTIIPSDEATIDAARRGEACPPSIWVHSSLLVDLQRKIDVSGVPTCSSCNQTHKDTPRKVNLLVCSSEVVASAGLPITISLQGRPQVKLPPYGDCFEVLMVLGGLTSSPREAIQRVYGNCRLPLNIILNLGEDAVASGESAGSVFSGLVGLKQWLERDFRRLMRLRTHVLITSPLQWRGEKLLYLSVARKDPMTFLQRTELSHLAVQIETCNSQAVAHNPHLLAALPRWCDFVGSRQTVQLLGNFGRDRTFVQVVPNTAVFADQQGDLHIEPQALLSLVRKTFQYMRR